MGIFFMCNQFGFFVLTYCLVLCSSNTYQGNVILDVNEILKDPKSNETQIKSTIEWFVQYHSGNANKKPVYLYYEYNFYEGLWNLQNALKRLKQTNLNIELLLNIKDQENTKYIPSLNQYVRNKYTAVINATVSQSSITKVSIEFSNLYDDSCTLNLQHTFDDKKSKILREVRGLVLSLSTRKLEIGYIVNLEYLYCAEHITSINNSDYIVININLRPNYDKIDVKSYGIFKENMEIIMKNVSNFFQNSSELQFSKPVFYKFNVHTFFNLGNIERKKCSKGFLTVESQQLVKKAEHISEKLYIKTYVPMLIQFIGHLMKDNQDLALITKITFDDAKKLKTKTLLSNNNVVIPQLTRLPVKRFDNIGMQSMSFLMKEIASSGFNTIMINGETWQSLTSQNFSEISCDSFSCRPQNVLYLNDMHHSFSKYTTNSILTLLETGGMHLKGLVFSSYYNDSQFLSWNSAITTLQAAIRSKKGELVTIETGCTEQTDIFGTLLNLDTSDIICDALELHKVFGCHSLGTTSNIIVWRGVLRLKIYDTQNIIENTIKKLDALILGRQMLQNQFIDHKQVILRIKVKYAKEGNAAIHHPIYCTSLGIKVYQLYELLLTWAQIYEFPIILEPINSVTGYHNPITWQQLKMLTHGQMHDVMEAFPIFIRRSYNQSRVFGSWTNGMYPCINLSKDNQSVKDIELHNKFLGVTVRLNLRLGNGPLRIDELQTILLLAFGKFSTAEIILHSDFEFQLLYDTVSGDDFGKNLKFNNLSQRKIYIDVSTGFSYNKTDIILGIVNKLKLYDFQVYIHAFSTNASNLFANYDDLSIRLALQNCTNVAKNLIMNNENYPELKNLEYLLCDTDKILADNTNLTAMQDYMESHLYLKKLFQYFFPNFKEIHFRLHPILIGDTIEDQSKNLFLFLADISKYANSYSIHYFLLDALSTEMSIDEASFWKSSNYQNLTAINSISEPLATFLNVSSWKPEIVRWVDEKYNSSSITPPTTESTSTYIPSTEVSSTTPTFTTSTSTLPSDTKNISTLPITTKIPSKFRVTTGYSSTTNFHSTNSGQSTRETMLSYQQTSAHNNQLQYMWMESTTLQYILISTLLLAFLVLLLAIKTMQNHRYLNKKEVNDFLYGRRETLEEAVVRRNRHTINNFNVFDGLVYQKEFEVSTRSIKMSKVNFGVTYTGMFSKVYKGKIEGCKNNISVEICNARKSKTYFVAMLSEVKMLCYIGSHDNIVKFEGSYTKEIRKGILWIVTEFSPDDSLKHYLEKLKEDITFQEMVKFSYEIANGMEYLSKQSVIHGDLRSKNVYLNKPNKTCKIGNFGMPRKLLEYEFIIQRGKLDLLPWKWMAVESLKKLEFSIQSDVWSYGVTIWEIFTMGNEPYEGDATFTSSTLNKHIKELYKGRRLGCPNRATTEIYAIMTECWTLEPQCRPGFDKLVKFILELQYYHKNNVL